MASAHLSATGSKPAAAPAAAARQPHQSPEELMNQLVLEMAERDLFNSLRPHLRREKVMPDSMSTGPIRRDFLKALARKWNLHKEPGFWSKHRDMLRLAMVLAEHGAARDLMRKESQARTAVATSAAGIRALRRALRPYTGEGFAGQSDNSDSLLYLSRQQPKSSARDYATGRRQDESEPEEEAEDDETRLDCLAALCNLTAVAASGAGLQSHFQAEEEAARSGATAPDAGGSAAGAAAADDDEDGGAGASEAPDAVPEPVLEPGVVGTLADFARTMGAGTAVDPADMELRCMLVTALLNISATRPFQARAVAEGAVPALMALMVPVTRQRARRGNAVSLSAAAAAMAAAEADDPAEAQRGSATGKGSPASNGSRVSPVGDVDADVDVGQAEGVGAGTADPAARGAADVSARSGLVEGDDSDAKEDDEVAFAAAVGTGRAGGLAGDDDDADDYGDDDFTADDVGKAGSPGTAAAAAAAAVGEEQDEEEEEEEASAGDIALALASADAYCIACAVRGLCNLSGSARGAEALMASGVVPALCGVWDMLTEGLRGAAAAHIVYNLTRTRSTSRKLAEEGGVLILRDVIVGIAARSAARDAPPAERRDGSAGSGEASAPGSSGDCAERLTEEESFALRRSAAASAHFVQDAAALCGAGVGSHRG
ncbi:hypothetical protein FNF29_08335 [Cafeteria roenbergensis]|uniref:Ataxin-10 domain-containing protein n=1 Tax=Cafeteria roenbergensis TaxID=33653 RepID=A0A5A8C054_CAFRO|nr:hypothetical protein FNF29_08335 [Cafeteria roenbergensis]|eukprot:KAA0145939.1 hypothetical protein FNF29_08335 [Cafeteria roenbergensis]